MPDCEFEVMMSVGGDKPIRSSRKRGGIGGGSTNLIWNEQLTLPNIFELNERVFIQLLATTADSDPPPMVLGGGFIHLSLGQMTCMLIGRDGDTGFRGPVALVRFQGRNVIDLKKIPKEICFTL